MSLKHYWPVAAALVLTVSGCTVGPNYHAPQMTLSNTFDPGPTTRPSAAATTQPDQRVVNSASWWRGLDDPELNSLVDRAVQSNLDLKMALMRLQAARASEFVLAGGVLPFVEGSGGAARGSGTNSVKGRISPPLNAATNTTGLKEITQVVGFDAGWEIDIFGRFRRELEAAAADTQAAYESRNVVLVTLVADVARAYVDMRTAQARLAIANQNIMVAQQTLDLVQQRFDRGLTNELDVALARRQIATERAGLAPFQVSVTMAQRRIAVLLGESPEALYSELAAPSPLPSPPVKVVTGLPVDLLRRRPDIRQAERQLAAENARIGVATADLFPRIALTAGLGLEGQGLGRSPKSTSFIWSAGPTAIVPLLDFGRIDSQIEMEDFRTQNLFYAYRRTVLGAIEEVDNAVDNFSSEQDRLDQLNEALNASKRAVTLATGRYERGLIDFLNVLDAQRQLYELQDQYTVAQRSLITQYVAVYKALGGGWEQYQAVPNLRQPLPAVLAAGATVLAHHETPIAQANADARSTAASAETAPVPATAPN